MAANRLPSFMSTKLCAILLALGVFSAAPSGFAQTPAPPSPAQPGGNTSPGSAPGVSDIGEEYVKMGAQTQGTGKIGTNAEMEIPQGFVFFPAKGAQDMMKRWGNLVDGSEDGLITHLGEGWSVLFSFSPEGYVKDQDKDALDADAMLKAMKEAEPAINEMLKKQGLPAQHTVGFAVPPKYNEKTNNLEWAQRFTIEGKPGEHVNYNTKLLGRRGVMTATLMVDPDKLQEVLPEYQTLLTKFHYTSGETYAEYRQGDKLATYGLAGLVVGGGAFAAAKMGLFAKFFAVIAKGGKAVIAGIVVVLVGLGKLLGRIFGRRDQRQFEQ